MLNCWRSVGEGGSKLVLGQFGFSGGEQNPIAFRESSHSGNFASNAGFSKTISLIDFILGIHDILGGIQKPIAYHRTPVVFPRMLASG